MEVKQTVDDILINGKSILNNKYTKARERICRVRGKKDISDMDIIEELVKEIDYYSNKIQLLTEIIHNTSQTIECERNIFTCGIDGGGKEYQVTTYYDRNGNLIKEEINCLNDKLKAIYKAEIFEYESGRTDTLFECDKDNNKECSKESCMKNNCCNHTLNKKYAKNYRYEI